MILIDFDLILIDFDSILVGFGLILLRFGLIWLRFWSIIAVRALVALEDFLGPPRDFLGSLTCMHDFVTSQDFPRSPLGALNPVNPGVLVESW